MTAPAIAFELRKSTVLPWSVWGITVVSTVVAFGAVMLLAHHTARSEMSETRLLLVLVVSVVLGGAAALFNGLVL